MQYSNQKILGMLKEIIPDIKPYIIPGQITNTASFRMDLGCDIYDMVEIVIQLEHEHGIAVKNPGHLEHASTVGEFCTLLSNELNKQEIPVTQKSRINLLNRVKQFFTRQN